MGNKFVNLKPLLLASLLYFISFGVASASSIISTTTPGVVGSIASVASFTSTTYVGGNFTQVGYNTPFHQIFDISTGNPDYRMPYADGNVGTAIPDGTGGWYIAGDFTSIGTTSVSGIAHILADGSVDDSFTVSTDGAVSAIALSSDGETLYIGGFFGTVNGSVARNNIAAFNTSDWTTTSFDPNIDDTISVIILSSDDSILYAGGNFTDVNSGTTRNRLASFTTADGLVTSFDPDIAGNVVSLALSSDDSILYAGGNFTDVNSGTTRNKLASFTTADGLVTSFDPSIDDNEITALLLNGDDSLLYVAGTFTEVNGGTLRHGLASFTTADGLATSFNSSLDNGVLSIALSDDESTLYAAGFFTTTDSGNIDRSFGASFDATTGTTTSFNPSFDVQPSFVSLSGTKILMGGGFTLSGVIDRNRFFSYNNQTGVISNLDINFDGLLRAIKLSSDGSLLYAAGNFSNVNGSTPRSGLASFTTSNGVATSFDPDISGTIQTIILSSDDSILYVGGGFTQVNGGTTRNRLASFTTSNGVVTSFDPDVNGIVQSLALSSDDSILYAGGAFTDVNAGTTRNRLTSFTTSNGVVTSFDPNMTGNVTALALSSNDSILYAGGAFTDVNSGTTRNRLASFTTADGLVTSFDPDVDASVNTLVLSNNDKVLYAGGAFTDVNAGTTRNRFAAFSTDTGTLNSFDLGIEGSSVGHLFINSDGSLYLGGNFESLNDGSQFYSRLDLIAIDNESGFSVGQSGGSTAVNESGTTDSFTVVLDFQPLNDVRLNILSSDMGEGTTSTSTLTFTTSNWNTPQTVTVTGIDDAAVDGSQGYTITVSVNPDSSYEYLLLSAQSINATTGDNDVSSGGGGGGGSSGGGNGMIMPANSIGETAICNDKAASNFGIFARCRYASSTTSEVVPQYATNEATINSTSTSSLTDDRRNASLCEPYLVNFINQRGRVVDEAGNVITGSDDIKKLQEFLNQYEGESLVVNDIYDKATLEAVMRFQEKYSKDILGFWGIKKGTGYVFMTTKWKINSIVCQKAKSTLSCPYLDYLNETSTGKGVLSLQMFLNTTQKENLTLNGIYNPETIAAVKRYQLKHKEQILTPWNLTEPTGLLRQTTRKQIHRDIGCFELPVKLPNGVIVE